MVHTEFGVKRWNDPPRFAVMPEAMVSESIHHLRIRDPSDFGAWNHPSLGMHVHALVTLDVAVHIRSFQYDCV